MTEKPKKPEFGANQGSHDELTARLEGLIAGLRDDLESNLNPNTVKRILQPLEELMEDTRELAELDQVHTALENKIVKPVRRAQARGTLIAVLFGIFGLIGVLGSLYSLYLRV